MGELSGQAPLDWLPLQGYGACFVCHRVLSSHFNGLHPRCYLALTAAVTPAPPAIGRPPHRRGSFLTRRLHLSWQDPDIDPYCCRDFWSMCLVHALASVVAHRDDRSWVDLLAMPALTLGGPSRGGMHHALRPAIAVSRHSQDWLDGLRGEPWEPSSPPISGCPQDQGSDFCLIPTSPAASPL